MAHQYVCTDREAIGVPGVGSAGHVGIGGLDAALARQGIVQPLAPVPGRQIDSMYAAPLADGVILIGIHEQQVDRKSTRLNSSHVKISYAVFCLKKKK